MRKALVTGGTRGIGAAVVDRLRRTGVEVHVWGHDVDVRSDQAIINAVKQIGDVDILCNSAGIFGPVGPAVDYDLADWVNVLATNLTGTFLVCKHVIPGMVKRGYGRVVNMSSVVVKDTNPNALAYCASKAGVEALTRGLALAYAQTGVTVNCVRPAAVNTDLFKGVPKDKVDAMLAKCPLGRFITVEEVAALVCWIASEECSATTGAAFDVAGGRCQF